MRIVIYQDFLRVGGTESQSLYLAKRIKEKGETVWVMTNRPGGRLAPRLKDFDLKHVVLQNVDFHINWAAPRLISQLEAIQPDIILLMGRNANGKGAELQKKFPRTSVISTFRTGRRLPINYVRSLESAPLICCNSEYSSDRLSGSGIDHQKIEVHPNACMLADEIEKTGPPTAPALEEVKIVYVAAFVPGKNHQGLMQMLPDLLRCMPTLKLHLVGEGPMQNRIRKLVEKSGLSENVIFEGYRNDIPSLLQQSHIAISPSLEESMPNALVEAQYVGLPIVAYDIAGVKECFLANKSGYLISPDKKAEFIEAVMRLAKDTEEWKRMSDAARIFARNKFEPNVRFDAFYHSVLKCHRSRNL